MNWGIQMNVEKALYHLKQAEKELSQYISSTSGDHTYDHQSYLIAMSNVFDFVHSIKLLSCSDNVIRDDY